MSGKSVFVTVCSRNTGYWHMFTSFQVAAAHLGENLGMRCRLHPHIGDSLISRARCIMLHRFLESDCDYLFTLDDDIELKPDAMTKLIQADRDIVGGIYRLKRKEVRTNPYAIRFLNENKTMASLQKLFNAFETNHLIDVTSKHWNPKWRLALYMPYIYNNEYLSEDWAFCQRAIDKGHKIWLHGGVQCVHWGLYPYSIDDLTEDQREVTTS